MLFGRIQRVCPRQDLLLAHEEEDDDDGEEEENHECQGKIRREQGEKQDGREQDGREQAGRGRAVERRRIKRRDIEGCLSKVGAWSKASRRVSSSLRWPVEVDAACVHAQKIVFRGGGGGSADGKMNIKEWKIPQQFSDRNQNNL
eukprot:768141-Hanusia_phi.AAC.5